MYSFLGALPRDYDGMLQKRRCKQIIKKAAWFLFSIVVGFVEKRIYSDGFGLAGKKHVIFFIKLNENFMYF